MKRAVIYGRVSTKDQNTENQLRELRKVARRNGWKITHEYIDHGISGAKGRDQRPEYNQLLKDAVRKEFDVIMAWSVDRLGRSMQHLIGFLDEIAALSTGVLQQNLHHFLQQLLQNQFPGDCLAGLHYRGDVQRARVAGAIAAVQACTRTVC